MELYARVRRAVQVEGTSEREAARQFGIARETVRKMQRYSVPPGYQRKKPVRRPKLGPWVGVIDQILKDDESRPKKQRHTAQRIWDRLKEEHGFTGGYTIVKDYVREARQRQQEMFVPLAHPPGDAQADFGDAWAVIGGKQWKAHFLCIDLPHSDDCFVMAFPAERTESFCEGHNQAFAYFGGVPRNIVYDNTKIAVAEILGDGKRKRTQAFTELQSHYLFEARFGRPAKGNDKGKVEGLVGYARRNFLVPAPLVGWELPAEFQQLRRLLEARLEKRGRRDYVQVLRLLETFTLEEVQQGVQAALRLGAISFDAVKHLVLCAIEQRPPRLDLENYPHLPVAEVAVTQATDYQALLSEVAR